MPVSKKRTPMCGIHFKIVLALPLFFSPFDFNVAENGNPPLFPHNKKKMRYCVASIMANFIESKL